MAEGKCWRVSWGTSLSMSTLWCCFRGRGYGASQYLSFLLLPPFMVLLRDRTHQVPGQPNKVILQRECICILLCSFQGGFMTKADPGRRRKGLTAERIPNLLK